MVSPDLSGVRVLIVEDDRDIAALCTEVLTLAGLVVTSVGTMRDALDALATSLPDVVVSDVQLPDGRLSTILQALEERPAAAAVPVIAMSGMAQAESFEHARVAIYLEKPFSLNVLLEVVARLAGRTPSGD
jgi:DNA-binding NtrC family response regulator